MNPGLPRLPAPPHDPRSLLLNGRIGFRAIVPPSGKLAAAIDPECCAISLPRLPSALRDLAEATGSLGGLRLPSNAALGPADDIYLLDRSRFQLKRFDLCACAFEVVPCFGGEGGAARQLRNAGDIAIACGNLYVCDTGLEAAPPVDACGNQPTADARFRSENHRVSVFALKGFALRGHLKPPAKEQPWRPVAVAVDSLGRVFVGDANGRLHRFTPGGIWERAWPMVPAPVHLAIDLADRIYVIAPGVSPSLRVLDTESIAVADPPHAPEDVRAAFPRLRFKVDSIGQLWLEACCDAAAANKTDPKADLVFDANGDPVELGLSAPPMVYAATATYRSDALDSHIAQCKWHRIVLHGLLPSGTRILVRAFCADEKLTPTELDTLADWQKPVRADVFDTGSRWDCLIRAQPGRYLWLELVLEGNGIDTPSIGAIVVEFPRISLRRYLPAVFGMEGESADFTDRFLALFDTTLRSIERRVDDVGRLFDPAATPASVADPRKLDFLSWLAGWVGIALDHNWDIATRRRFLNEAGALFDRRGTPQGLRRQLLLLLGFDLHAPCTIDEHPCDRCVPVPRNCAPALVVAHYEMPSLVLEHFRLRRWLRLGAGRLGEEAVVWGERIVGRTKLGAYGRAGVTRLDTSPDPERDPFLVHANQFSVFVPSRCRDNDRTRKALENLVKTEAPAQARGYLHFVEPRFRIGIQSMLGFDAVVGAIPQGITLGTTPIGPASVLTSPPHKLGGPAFAVGKEGRIGTTSLLA